MLQTVWEYDNKWFDWKNCASNYFHNVKISKSDKSDCTESGILFSISGIKMLSVFAKKSIPKPGSFFIAEWNEKNALFTYIGLDLLVYDLIFY